MIVQNSNTGTFGSTQTSYELKEIAANAAVGYFLTPVLFAAQITNSDPVLTALLAIPLTALALPAAPFAIAHATYLGHQQAKLERADFRRRYPKATQARRPSVGILWT